jgi:hypothetical protein
MLELTVQISSLGGAKFKPLIHLRWKVDHQSVFEYQVFRGDKANDVTTLITTVPAVAGAKVYTYDDQDVRLGHTFKEYFYVVKARLINGNTREETEPKSWFTLYRREELSILSMQEYYFREQAGHPFFLFSRKNLEYDYCPECWDVAEHRAKTPMEGCKICYGTGIREPFYPSEVVWAAENVAVAAQDAGEMGRVDRKSGELTMNGIPHVFPGDCLMDHTVHRFFEIDSVQSVGHHGRPVLQQLKVKEIAHSDSIYRWLTI